MSPLTVAQLRQHGVTDQATLELEVFFYTDTEAKSTALAASLKALNYDVQIGASSGEGQPYIVTGQTIPIAMDEHSVVEWTDQMCRIGYKHDCLFDGWGTNLEQ
ncbi:MAG: ribonuclease E inhibitor RraB [Planctomycetales bacterium]|nr:ribonuclease E inhibitor RraB [Planctomycetales bacterium]